MEDYNETTDGYFLMEYLLGFVVSMLWYRIVLFRCLEGRTLADSRIILWGLVGLCNAWGIRCQWESRRLFRDIMTTQAVGFGLYTVAAYLPVRPALVWATLAVTAVLACLYVVLIRIQPIRASTRARVRRVLQFRRRQSVAAAARTLAVGLAVLQGGLFLSMVLQGTVLASRVTATNEYTDGGVTEEQLATLGQLEPGIWQTLNAQERVDVLQTVANIEQTSLGLSNELNVAADDMEEEGLCGYYQDETHQIMINTEKLLRSDSGYLVELTCHEAFHGYQHRLTELYAAAPEETRNLLLLQSAERYTQEFEHYADGEDDYAAYYNQACESDARAYAAGRIFYYESLTGLTLTEASGTGVAD